MYATSSRHGTLDQAIKYARDDLKIRMPLALMLLSTLPGEPNKLGVSADYVETTTTKNGPCDHLAARKPPQVWTSKYGLRRVADHPTDRVVPRPVIGEVITLDRRPAVQPGWGAYPAPVNYPLILRETSGKTEEPGFEKEARTIWPTGGRAKDQATPDIV
jgi:hypothetical protein